MNKKVYFVPTCLVEWQNPKVAISAIRVLEYLGYEVIQPKFSGCCGQPAFNSGFRGPARRVANALITQMTGDNFPIIVPSGSCGSMMKNHYQSLFDNDTWENEINTISKRIHEWTSFVNKELAESDFVARDAPTVVALHTSCHAMREMGIDGADQQILQKIKNISLANLKDSETCCGFGGTFAIKHSDISGRMLEDKINAVSEVNPDYFISAEAGCFLHISGGLQKKVKKVPRFEHLAVFIERHLKERQGSV